MEGLDGKYVDIGFSGAVLIVLLALGVCLVVYYFLRKCVDKKVILSVFTLFAIGYAIRLFILLRNPIIYGIDGPWYVAQITRILQGGSMAAFTEPLVMYFTAGLSVFAGDITLGVKIAQAFLSALPILTTWLLAKYITKSDRVSIIAALLVGLSAMTVGMSDVLRNTGALAFLPLFYLFFLKFVKGEGRKWAIKTPIKVRGKRLELTFSSSLVLSFIFFAVILGCHFLTAGFAVMTVAAYIAFFSGYRMKIPWPELKFLVVLSILMLVGIVASGGIREKILGTANTIATSEPVPAGLFPFSTAPIPTPGGGNGGPAANMFVFFIPFVFLSLPAMWFTLKHSDRRYLLFTATILLCLLCAQDWIVNYMYSFRFTIMVYIALFILMGISILQVGKHTKKVAVGILIGAVGFSVFTLVGMGATGGAWISEEEWTELRDIGQQLPDNSIIITPGLEGLFYWGPLLFEKELGTTFMPWGHVPIESLADQMKNMGQTGTLCLAVVQSDFIAGVENLEQFGLKIYDNLQTEHYAVLQLAENSDNMNQQSVIHEGHGGLPEYPDATKLEISEENIEENYLGGYFDLSPPEVSAAVYSTTASYSEVLSWYKTEMPKLGWTKVFENENSETDWGTVNFSKGGNGAIIIVNSSPGGQIITLLKGPAEMLGWPTGPSEGPQGGPSQEPVVTNEIRLNHNPLFAFILLPIEFVQALYGTAVYGILKLVVAIPLSVGLIGFLLGLGSILWQKFKGWRKIQRRR